MTFHRRGPRKGWHPSWRARMPLVRLPPPPLEPATVPTGVSGAGSDGLAGPIADITALITALGGNALVPAFYDGRLNVTASLGVASLWRDARGLGFGPDLTAAGAAQPSYVGNNQLVFDGVNNQMVSAAVAAFDLSNPISLVFVASAAAATTGLSMGAISDAGATNVLDQQFQAGPDWGSFTSGGNSLSAGVGSADGVIRVVALTMTGLATTAQVPNHARQTGTCNAAAAGNRALTLGTYSTGQGKCPSTQYAVIVYAGVLSAGQVTAILNWAVLNRAAVAAA
jgi:hypothetical protein